MSLTDNVEVQEARLLNCVHCGFCLPACPTYRRLGDEADSPRGRLYLMRAVVEGRLDPASDAFQTHMDRCLGCRACETVCPSGVEYGLLLEDAREEAIRAKPLPLYARMLLWVFEGSLSLRASMFGSRFLRATGIPALGARWLPRGWGFGRIKLALAMLAASTPARFRAAKSAVGVIEPAAGRGPSHPTMRVGVLQGCVQAGLFGRVNAATHRVLEANGYEVVPVSGQGCCGALHAHAGTLDGARALAWANVEAFERAEVDRIALNAAGCGAAMREYGQLFSGDDGISDRAQRISAKVRDISELLAERGPRVGAPLPMKVTYDAPCHLLHAQRIADPPKAVLGSIPELDVVALPRADECCGGAGIYGLTHPALGGSIGGDKVRAVLGTGAAGVVTGNPGCMMQIGAGLRSGGHPVDVWHPVELLDESYRRAGLYS